MKRFLKLGVLLLVLVTSVSVFAMRWQCITIGGSGGGMSCRVCAFFDDDGNNVGGYVSCN